MRGPTARLVHLARDVGGLAVDHAQSAPLLAIAYHDECPVLCIARRGRSNGGIQNAGDDFLWDWIGFESAQGSCGVDGVKQSDLRHREPHSVFERLGMRLGMFAGWSLNKTVRSTMAG